MGRYHRGSLRWDAAPGSRLLILLAQLAALPADQRAALARLLAPPTDTPAGPTLDDTLPPALERTAAPRDGGAKGDGP